MLAANTTSDASSPRAPAQAQRIGRPQHDGEQHAERPLRRASCAQRAGSPCVSRIAAPSSDAALPAHCDAVGRHVARERRGAEDRDRRQRQHQQRVDRAAVAQRHVDQRMECGDAGRAERDQQAPVAPDRLPAAPRLRADPRQQQREAERPAQQVQRRRVDVGAQRPAGDEVAGPEERGPRQREDRAHVAHQCVIAAAASARSGIA